MSSGRAPSPWTSDELLQQVIIVDVRLRSLLEELKLLRSQVSEGRAHMEGFGGEHLGLR